MFMALWPDSNSNGTMCELADINREIILAAAAQGVQVEPIRAPYWRKKFNTHRLRCKGNTCYVVMTSRRTRVREYEYWQFSLRTMPAGIDYLFLCVIDSESGFLVYVVPNALLKTGVRILTIPVGEQRYVSGDKILWLDYENAWNTITPPNRQAVSRTVPISPSPAF
jgi:hypothetical protein